MCVKVARRVLARGVTKVLQIRGKSKKFQEKFAFSKWQMAAVGSPNYMIARPPPKAGRECFLERGLQAENFML